MPGSPPITGIAGRTALSISGAVEGALSNVRVATSGSDQGLAADPHDVAGDRGRSRVGVPSDGLGDVDRLTTLRQRAEPATGLADAQRHGLDHVGLDEPGSDRVDRDAVLGDPFRQVVDEADDAGLGRAVARLAVVARDAGDRRDADDTSTGADEL